MIKVHAVKFRPGVYEALDAISMELPEHKSKYKLDWIPTLGGLLRIEHLKDSRRPDFIPSGNILRLTFAEEPQQQRKS
jgi:hypothetical protein